MIKKYDKEWKPHMSVPQRIKEGYLQEGKEIDLTNDIPEPRVLRHIGIGSVFLAHQQKTIYFAHPFDKRFAKRKEMIIRKLEAVGYIVVDPFDGEDDIAKRYGVDNYYQNPCRAFALEIKDRDFKQVISCDALFAWIVKGVTQIGTIREFDKAIEHGKHTIVLCYKPNPFVEDADELYLTYQDFLESKEFIWK